MTLRFRGLADDVEAFAHIGEQLLAKVFAPVVAPTSSVFEFGLGLSE